MKSLTLLKRKRLNKMMMKIWLSLMKLSKRTKKSRSNWHSRLAQAVLAIRILSFKCSAITSATSEN